jgi:dihydrofolate synthase/folylpolyglutamate synthase
MAFASLDEALQVLYTYIPGTTMRENYTLDGVRRLLKWLGDPQEAHRAIHVAGTSGKTSTAYYIRGLLEAAGAHTALTVSPHITGITERFQISGEVMPSEIFLDRMEEFLQILRSAPVRPTFYELLICFAYWYFASLDLDYMVIETGLGGRLDATNTIARPDKICVITDIGLDHCEILGDTVEEIAAEKAGIINKGNVAFIQDQADSVLDVICRHAHEAGASARVVGPAEPVPGLVPHQLRNWNLAVTAARYCAQPSGRPAAAALHSPELPSPHLPHMNPPGRFEFYRVGDRKIVLDGAHNPQKLTSLVEALRVSGISEAAVIASFIRSPQAKMSANLLAIRDLAAELTLVQFGTVQDLAKESPPAAELAAEARQLGSGSVTAAGSLAEALDRALASRIPAIVITGSLYLVAQIRPLIIQATKHQASGRRPEGC